MKNKIQELINNNHIFAPALVIGFAMVIVSFVMRSGIVSIANKDQSITVTGSTERIVNSDTAKWTISLSEKAYGENASLNSNKNLGRSSWIVREYLKKSGIKDEEINTQANSNSPICELNNQGYENCSVGVKGQTAMTNIVVESNDVEKIKSLSEKMTGEISVNVTNNLVEYYFSKLKDIRVDMLSEATKNARERADAVAKAGGATVGNITSLSSGVFQVTQKNSVSVDDYGAYDTTSIEKKITATVKVNFSVR